MFYTKVDEILWFRVFTVHTLFAQCNWRAFRSNCIHLALWSNYSSIVVCKISKQRALFRYPIDAPEVRRLLFQFLLKYCHKQRTEPLPLSLPHTYRTALSIILNCVNQTPQADRQPFEKNEYVMIQHAIPNLA